jgi:hypothetical protein
MQRNHYPPIGMTPLCDWDDPTLRRRGFVVVQAGIAWLARELRPTAVAITLSPPSTFLWTLRNGRTAVRAGFV